MNSDQTNARIRVRSIFGYKWQWQLVTSDGHIVNASEPFGDRDACEADAQQQGIQVDGLRRKKEKPPPSPTTREPHSKWRFPRDRVGLWQWRRLNDEDQVVEESTRAFLTKDECIEDARKNGYAARDPKRIG